MKEEKKILCKWIIYRGFLELFAKDDDGRPVSKPKQTHDKNTHTLALSGERDEVIGGCETCFILIAGLEHKLHNECLDVYVCSPSVVDAVQGMCPYT